MKKLKTIAFLSLLFLLSGCVKAQTVFSIVGINDNASMIKVYVQDLNRDLETRFDGNTENDFSLVKEYKISDKKEMENFFDNLKKIHCEESQILANKNVIVTDYIFIDIGDKTFYFHKEGTSFYYNGICYTILAGSIDFLNIYLS